MQFRQWMKFFLLSNDAPNPACPVGKNIHAVLDEKLESANQALRDDLAKTTLKDLLDAIL